MHMYLISNYILAESNDLINDYNELLEERSHRENEYKKLGKFICSCGNILNAASTPHNCIIKKFNFIKKIIYESGKLQKSIIYLLIIVKRYQKSQANYDTLQKLENMDKLSIKYYDDKKNVNRKKMLI